MSTGMQIANSITMLWTIFVYSSPLLLVLVLFIWKTLWKKYPLEAIIIEKRGDNLIKTNDRLGKYVDKHTGLTGYKLLKAKDTMPIYNFDWVIHNVPKETNILEKLINLLRANMGTVFLFRYGSKQYKPINPGLGKDKLELVEVKGKDGKSTYVYQYNQFDLRGWIGALNFEIVDWDNINFMVQEQRASIERRKNRDEFWKAIAIPALMIGAAVVFGIFVMKFSMDWGKEARAGMAATPEKTGGGSKIGGVIDGFVPGQ